MWRFGLPEFRMGGRERDLRDELREILLGVTFRVWSHLVKEAQARPDATGLVRMPRSVQIPVEMDIHRKDLDQARGTPNRGGASTTIALRFDSATQGRSWLTVCPPSWRDGGWDDFIADVCHAMFGFEKPTWYYLPHIGALMEARRSLPEARRRFNDGELPGQLAVRYDAPANEGFRWARVESWADEDLAIVRDIGPALGPPVRPGRAIAVETKLIFDWAVWSDGDGAIEGAGTNALVTAFGLIALQRSPKGRVDVHEQNYCMLLVPGGCRAAQAGDDRASPRLAARTPLRRPGDTATGRRGHRPPP